jgi:endonuclease/exonuclease/phosphatase (EEP) superfamily protein YafD
MPGLPEHPVSAVRSPWSRTDPLSGIRAVLPRHAGHTDAVSTLLRQPTRPRLSTVLLGLAAVPFAVLAGLRLLGIDGGRYTIAALALTPYATVAGAVLAALALLLRHWWIGGVVLGLVLALVVAILPRVWPDDVTDAGGPRLRVMALNLHYGQANAGTVVDLVRTHRVDVLGLPELNSAAVDELTRAGLFELLPHTVLHPAASGAGSGIASRYPLLGRDLVPAATQQQAEALVDLAGGRDVEFVAVHPIAPTFDSDDWKAELEALPHAGGREPLRVLAGDFNATLDHAALRRLLDAGYRDAGAQRGDGLVATWPGEVFPPPVTIDHVLADERLAVLDYRVLDVPGTDHDAVYAELALP